MYPFEYHVVNQYYPLDYHRQSDLRDCGEACAQMVLRSLDHSIALYQQTAPLDKELVRHTTRDQFKGWGANPVSLRIGLNGYGNSPYISTPDYPPYDFKLLECNCEQAISHWIVYGLLAGKPAAIVLVLGKDHWVTVYGVDLIRRGTGAIDPLDVSSYEIRAFYVFDPAPGGEADDERRDHDNDDTCGMGALPDKNKPKENWGLQFTRVNYTQWQKVWLTGVPVGSGSSWDGKFVAIMDTSGLKMSDLSDCPNWNSLCQQKRQWPEHEQQPPLRNFIPNDQVKPRVIADLQNEGLTETDAPEPWCEYLRNLQTGYVIRVDNPHTGPDGSSYYLASMVASDGSEPVVVMINAVTGDLLQTSAIRRKDRQGLVIEGAPAQNAIAEPDLDLTSLEGPTGPTGTIINLLQNNDVRLDDIQGSVRIQIDSVDFVWKHTVQTQSPYMPVIRLGFNVVSPNLLLNAPTVSGYLYVQFDGSNLPRPPFTPGVPLDLRRLTSYPEDAYPG